jgi:FkbM family methyltransferase
MITLKLLQSAAKFLTMRKTDIVRLTNGVLARLGARIESQQQLEALESRLDGLHTRMQWLSRLATDAPDVETIPRSQIGQDLFALWANDFKRGGFFVEIGAAGGVALSNTYLLERSFGWTGILAEPARSWQESLHLNRHCALDDRCVWRESGLRIRFSETSDAEFSTVSEFIERPDGHAHARTNATSYEVQTVSLADLLTEHQAPPRIDYLSVDTEGSEQEILHAFDFDTWRFNAITVEHAFVTDRRCFIHDLLSRRGYQRVYLGASEFDDWYIQGRD